MNAHKYIWLCLLLAAVSLIGAVSPAAEHISRPLSENYMIDDKSEGYLWPSETSKTITSLFGKRNIELYGYEREHTGIDIHGAIGTNVYAIADGTVIVSTYDDGWGEYMIINHGDNILSLYAHMNCRTLKRGESVTRGQRIGELGNTGFSSGPHLHFEIRENGKPINPLQFTYADE